LPTDMETGACRHRRRFGKRRPAVSLGHRRVRIGARALPLERITASCLAVQVAGLAWPEMPAMYSNLSNEGSNSLEVTRLL
jgi:hypothetical protein